MKCIKGNLKESELQKFTDGCLKLSGCSLRIDKERGYRLKCCNDFNSGLYTNKDPLSFGIVYEALNMQTTQGLLLSLKGFSFKSASKVCLMSHKQY